MPRIGGAAARWICFGALGRLLGAFAGLWRRRLLGMIGYRKALGGDAGGLCCGLAVELMRGGGGTVQFPPGGCGA